MKKEFKKIFIFVKSILKNIIFVKNNNSLIDPITNNDHTKYNTYGFDEQGIDIDNKSIEYYKKELNEIQKRQKVWQLDLKYDIKIYATRRVMENILILVLRHNYGSDFLKNIEQRSLCNYVNKIFEDNLLGWDTKRFNEICTSKQYMNNIIHPYQSSFNEYKNKQLKICISKLIQEYKKHIGLYQNIDKTLNEEIITNYNKAA